MPSCGKSHSKTTQVMKKSLGISAVPLTQEMGTMTGPSPPQDSTSLDTAETRSQISPRPRGRP